MQNELEIISSNEQLMLAYGRFFRNIHDCKNVMVSISGGADSDIMLDMLLRFARLHNVDCKIFKFVFFDTGIEYQATKRHLDYLQEKYGIVIERLKAKVPVPLGCKKYGVPFISKDISAKINSLQNNNFDFAKDGNKDFEYLSEKYKKCISVIKWWCNVKDGFNIESEKYLKEFMIAYPPNFKISQRCCDGAKKKPSHLYEVENNIDCKCLGLRKAEGGIRATKNQTCFTPANDKCDYNNYRPLWYFSDKDKEFYKTNFDVKHSDCYEVWGFKRTGCCGCPFNSRFEEDLLQVKKYEPKLYKACNNIFGESYEYTRAYRKFKAEMKLKEKQTNGQLSIFDYFL